MNLKKYTIISIIAIFLLSILSHFIYTWFPNVLTSIFFPVNESIFEHTKMTFTTMIIWGFISYFLFKKIRTKNFIPALLISIIITNFSLLIIFTPIFFLNNQEENLILTLIIYLISIIIGQIINYSILKNTKASKKSNIISSIIIIIIFIINGILTYYPIKNSLFYDFHKNKYSINNYQEKNS